VTIKTYINVQEYTQQAENGQRMEISRCEPSDIVVRKFPDNNKHVK